MLETLKWLAIYCANLEQWGVTARIAAAIDTLYQISSIVPPDPYQ